MGLDAWLTLATVVATLVLLATERVAPAAVVFGADIALLLMGVIDAEAALSGFSNPAPFTVAALFVAARAVEKTGGLQPLLVLALGNGRSARGALARLLLPVAAGSAFLNNTPIVAMTAPQVGSWAEQRGHSPSHFLMPLSFAAILGGVVTVIGTSTNLVVSGLLTAHGMPAMGMFEITALGLPVAVVGLVYLVVASDRLLPARVGAFQEIRERTREFFVQMEVVRGGVLDGTTVEQGGLRHLKQVFLIEVRRADGETVAPAGPTTRLEGGDVLVFAGGADDVLDLRGQPGLVSLERKHVNLFQDAGHSFFEAVVGTNSPLVGQTLKESDFRSRYDAAVIGIHRSGEPVRRKLGTVDLKPGDNLLILADEGFAGRWRDRSDFLLIAARDAIPPASTSRAMLAVGALAAVVVLGAAGVVPILHAALGAALLMVATGVLSPTEARRAVDLNVIVLIAAAFGLAAAVEGSGLAATTVEGMMSLFGGLGERGLLLGVILTTLLLTELITNNAAAVLIFPIALSAAASADMDPRAVALAVAVTASASFLTPIGYQTNTMVYGPGGYRFTDYVRLGLPLTVLVVLVLMLLTPV